MAIRDIFLKSGNRLDNNNVNHSASNSSARNLDNDLELGNDQFIPESPAINVLKGLESPFIDMDLYRTSKKKEKLNSAKGSNNYAESIPKPRNDQDPYTSLKYGEEIDRLYQNILEKDSSKKLSSPELKRKIELIRVKYHQVCKSLAHGSVDLNFMLQDFVGHIALLLDSSNTSGMWTIPFLLPFLKVSNNSSSSSSNFSSKSNCYKAFSECAWVIRHLSTRQSSDFRLSRELLSVVWEALFDSIHDENVQWLAAKTLKDIIEHTPLEYEAVNNVIELRRGTSEFFSSHLNHLRLLHSELLELLYQRFSSNNGLAGDCQNGRLAQELIWEMKQTEQLEPDQVITCQKKYHHLHHRRHFSSGMVPIIPQHRTGDFTTNGDGSQNPSMFGGSQQIYGVKGCNGSHRDEMPEAPIFSKRKHRHRTMDDAAPRSHNAGAAASVKQGLTSGPAATRLCSNSSGGGSSITRLHQQLRLKEEYPRVT